MQADGFCLVVGQEKIITSKSQNFFLVNEQAWKSTKDLKNGDILSGSWAGSGEIREIIELGSTVLIEIEVEDIHNFFVSEGEFLVHNFAAAATINLGYIAISNPVVALVGATIALAVLTPKLYNSFIKYRESIAFGQDVVPSVVTEKDSDLIERYYFVLRKKMLEDLKDAYTDMNSAIQRFSSSHNIVFTSTFFSQVLPKHFSCYSVENIVISVAAERQFDSQQKQALRKTRQLILREIEREILA